MSTPHSVPSTAVPGEGAAGPILHVLGRLELLAPDGTIVLGPGKPLAVLAFLRAQSMRAASRPQLIDLLWSDLEPERARANLRQALLVLRRLLPDGALVSDGDLVVLRTELPVDREAFVAAVDRGALPAAIALYRGDFIPDLAVPGGAEFELWCDIERRHLAALFARVLETTARSELSAGRASDALRLARRLRDLDSTRERSWRLLIEAEIASEGVATARLEADTLAELLSVEGRPPEPATALLFQRVREVARPEAAGNGVLSAPEFVGRETQLARVLAAWGAVKKGHLHHVHIEARAGTGKTRLLDESFARLHAAGARIVRCGARRDERGVAYSLAATVVTVLSRLPGSIAVAPASMAALVAMAPDASGVFAAQSDASTGDEAMRRRALALADLLGAVSHETAVALALDDMHWADQASLHVLSLAVGRLPAGTRLLLLSAGREPLAGEARAERISLPPLTVAQVDAMLQSLSGAGDTSWWSTFVAMLRDAADGVPFHVLQLLHATVEKQLLLIEDEVWRAPNVPALLTALDAVEAARVRFVHLPMGAQKLLRVLCSGNVPDVTLAATAVSAEATAVEADLGLLETRGYVRRLADGTWTAAHDEICELTIAQSDVASLRAARRGLALALAARPNTAVSAMRHIVALLTQADADSEIDHVVRAWVRSGACPRVGVQAGDLLPPGLPEERSARIQRTLRRSLPGVRRGAGWSARIAALLGVVALLWYLTRPAALVLVQSPILASESIVPDRPAVIGVVDRLGRRLSTDRLSIRASTTGLRAASGRVVEEMQGGVAVFDSLLISAYEGESYEFIFSAEGVAPVRFRDAHDLIARLRFRSGSINGEVVEGEVPRIVVAPGARLTGSLIFEYASSWPTATIFFGSVATWSPRESDTTSIRSLVTPIQQGFAQARVARIAPSRPGRYFLIFAMGAEPRAAYLFSSSNWTCGDPIWHDGDDVQDLPPDALRAYARAGTRTARMVKCHDGSAAAAPLVTLGTIGLAAIEVEVRSR